MKIKKIKLIKDNYTKFIEPYKDEALEELKNLVEIDSTYDEKSVSEKTPFGKGVSKALEYVASLGARLGFNVDRCDNYVTELSFGEGKILDIYAHVDVVPVIKKDWVHNPFKLTIEDKIMYGRGSADDKGPGIACLYACKALMDNNKLGGYKLRFLFGGNEESGSLCLHHYFKEMKKEYPTFGFSPDADYPLIYAEKTISSYKAEYNVDIPCSSFSFGEALNVVLSETSLSIDKTEEELNKEISYYESKHKDVKIILEGNRVTFIGVPAHGSTPYNGVNAGLHLLNFLAQIYNLPVLGDIYDNYVDGRGNKFNGNYLDKVFRDSTYNVGKISYDHKKKKLSIFVNFRFPSSYKYDDLLLEIGENTNSKITPLGYSDGYIANLDSPYINALLDAYRINTGDYLTKPLAIGGGTYARESKNSVAFGACFPSRDYKMHGNDEFFPLDDFYANMQIYAHAIDILGNILRK